MIGGKYQGFTLVELIAVLVIASVLSVTAYMRIIPSNTYQMQASRDEVVTAFFIAQQLAMNQADPIRLTISSGEINILQDSNLNDSFEASENVAFGSSRYPIEILSSQTLTDAIIDFDRLGQPSTGALTLVLSQNANSVNIEVSESGFVR